MNLTISFCFLSVYIFFLNTNSFAFQSKILEGSWSTDTTPVSSVYGNSATTLGQQRFNVVKAAMNYWGKKLYSDVPVEVNVSFISYDPYSYDPPKGVNTLAQAYPAGLKWNHEKFPYQDTTYPLALANSLAGIDLWTEGPDIELIVIIKRKNILRLWETIDWSYNIGGSPPSGQYSLYEVLKHEVAHGLGFGAFGSGGAYIERGQQHIYRRFVIDAATQKEFYNMTADEAILAYNNDTLGWDGERVRQSSSFLTAGKHPGTDYVLLYTPGQYTPEIGNSWGEHWDISLTPDELLEPEVALGESGRSSLLTLMALYDMGWRPPVSIVSVLPLLLNGSKIQDNGLCAARGISGSDITTWNGRKWQRCGDGNTYTWEDAIKYCADLIIDGDSEWRLPTKDELKSLVICTNGVPTPLNDLEEGHPYNCYTLDDAPFDVPTIDSSFECRSSIYWSSTAYDDYYSYTVDFEDGMAHWYNHKKGWKRFVRCIRNE